MKKQVYEIGDTGLLKEIYVAEVDKDGIILDIDKQGFITTDPPHGLYNPRWTGTEWVEGATQEEIDEITKLKPSPPTDTEILGQQMTEREIESMFQGQQNTDIELRLIMLEV